MRKLGQNPTEEELQEMISSVDDNGDKEIDFEEFLILMKSRCLEQDPEKELRDAFAVFDTDGSGSIDRKELKRLMKKLGQALTEAEVDAMMDEVDSNGDGEISYEEFKHMMVRCLLPELLSCHWFGTRSVVSRLSFHRTRLFFQRVFFPTNIMHKHALIPLLYILFLFFIVPQISLQQS